MNYSQFSYNVYRSIERYLMRKGINRILGPGGSALASLGESLLRHLQRSKPPTIAHMNGFEMSFPGNGYFPWEIARGEYEPKTTRWFYSLLESGMTVVDVGAHVGYYSLLAGQVVGPKGRIYAFEPDPVTYTFLKQNVDANDLAATVHCVNAAVSDRVGEAKLFIGRRDRVANSLLRTTGAFQNAITCAVTTLDEYFRKENWPSVGLMKIDVEGSEYSVLQGMRGLSVHSPSLSLIIEFHPTNLVAAGVQAHEFFEALRGNGFTRFFVISDVPEPVSIPGDILALLEKAGPAFLNLLCTKTDQLFP